MYIIKVVFCFILLVSCQNNKYSKPVDQALIVNCWLHSHEENIDQGILVFRHCDYKDFAPSRYRSMLDFKEDFTCKYSQLSPVDAHNNYDGMWSYSQADSLLEIKDKMGNVVFKYHLSELNQERMVVQIIE